MVWSSLAPKWPIPVPFCGMDHQKSNFSLTSDTLSVGGCWGQPMEFFWKLVDETQIFKPPEAARHHNSIRLLVLLPLRADLLYILHYETPCIDVKKLNDYEIINTFVHQGNKFQKLTMVYSILSKNLKRKGYLSNLLVTTLLPRFFVFWDNDFKFWLQLRFFEPVKMAGSDLT